MWRIVTFSFEGKGTTFAGTFAIEVDDSGVPVQTGGSYNFTNISGNSVNSTTLVYDSTYDYLAYGNPNYGEGKCSNFSTATSGQTYTETGYPVGEWSYTNAEPYEITIGTDSTGENGTKQWADMIRAIEYGGELTILGNEFNDETGVGVITIAGMTTLPDDVFESKTYITSIVLPDCFTTIGDAAFAGCTSLESIVLPDTITTIGADAFSECTSLTSLILPAGLTSIGEGALDACESLETVICLAEVPPTTGTTISNITLPELLVPGGSVRAYQSDAVWGSAFTSIKSMTPGRGYGFNFEGMIDIDYMREI